MGTTSNESVERKHVKHEQIKKVTVSAPAPPLSLIPYLITSANHLV